MTALVIIICTITVCITLVELTKVFKGGSSETVTVESADPTHDHRAKFTGDTKDTIHDSAWRQAQDYDNKG